PLPRNRHSFPTRRSSDLVEDGEARIPVSRWDVAQHLVVGAVLANDVHHMTHWRFSGQAVGCEAAQAGVGIRTEGVHLAGVASERDRKSTRLNSSHDQS